MNRNVIILIAAALSFTPANLSAQPKIKNTDLFNRIDKDFSRFPFDMMEEDARKLKIDGVTYTETEEGFGQLIDEAGVVHNFYDGLYGKRLTFDPAAPRKPTKLLRLGLARKQKDVEFAFRKYSGGQAMECWKANRSEGEDVAEADKRSFYCDFNFDPEHSDARMVLTFDKYRYLTEINVMAWNPF